MDKGIKKIVCRHCGRSFPILDKEKNLLEKLSPYIDKEKYIFDIPNICPECRQRQRLSFRNERKFYKTICLNCKKDIISTISLERKRKILCQECFENEKFDNYKLEYNGDFRQCLTSIFDNNCYKSILTQNMDNSPYCNQETNDKNCYLNVGGHGNEKSFYNTYSINSKYTLDNYFVVGSEIIFESIYIIESNKIFFSYMVEKSYNIFFGYDLKGCQNVLFGYGKQNSSYIYKNEILSKEAWQEKYKDFKKKLKTYSGFQELQKEYEEFLEKFPRKHLYNIGCENTRGNNNIYLKETPKNIQKRRDFWEPLLFCI